MVANQDREDPPERELYDNNGTCRVVPRRYFVVGNGYLSGKVLRRSRLDGEGARGTRRTRRREARRRSSKRFAKFRQSTSLNRYKNVYRQR
jgi:hypothetical protein